MTDELKEVTVPIEMPVVCWRLMGMYLTAVNYDRLARKGGQANWKEVLEILLQLFTLENADSIRKRFYEIQLEQYKRAIPRFFSLDQTIAIANASAADIPHVFTIGWRRRCQEERRAVSEDRRALLGTASRAQSPTFGPLGQSGQVRGRSLQLVTGVGRQAKKS